MTDGAALAIANAIDAATERLVQAIKGLTSAVVLDAGRCKVAQDEVEDAVELAKRLIHEGNV